MCERYAQTELTFRITYVCDPCKKCKLISVFTIAGNVSRIGMFGGGNKVSKFMMLTLPRKVNYRETS